MTRNESLRDYQQWLYKETYADDGNTIVVAPTGVGKTRVAFALVQTARERHPTRAVIVLCPTIALATQQHGYWSEFSTDTNEISLLIAGNKKTSFFDEPYPCVVFATPAKLGGFLGTCTEDNSIYFHSHISLMIIDECHHANRMQESNQTGDTHHPYAAILDVYRDIPDNKRPKLLGLTASPGGTGVDVKKLAKVLEARFLRPAGSLLTSMRSHCSDVKTEIHRVEDAELVNLKHLLERRRKRVQGTEQSRCTNFLALLRCVGNGRVLEGVCDGDVPYPDDHFRDWNTDQEGRASNVLKAACKRMDLSRCKHREDFRAILFVSTTKCAAATTKLIMEDKMLNPRGKLKPITFVGQQELTLSRQRSVLDTFRRGDANVLVATTVAEEGIDIQQCCIVIRTEAVSKIISNIQGRGRARAMGASYVIMAIDDDEEKKAKELPLKERIAEDKLVTYIESAGVNPALTSWSHFEVSSLSPRHARRLQLTGAPPSVRNAHVHDGSSVSDGKCALNIFLQDKYRPSGAEKQRIHSYQSGTLNNSAHAPIWLATVTVNHVTFEGKPCSTKKASENYAAYVALANLEKDFSSYRIDHVNNTNQWEFARTHSDSDSQDNDDDDDDDDNDDDDDDDIEMLPSPPAIEYNTKIVCR